MSKNINSAVFKTLSVVFILLTFTLNVFPKLIANYSEVTFQDQEKSQVRMAVMEAAGDFLKSQSDVLLLLNKIELEEIYGVQFSELRDLLSNAIAKMENTKIKYAELVNISATAPYNQTIIDKLRDFDYTTFQKTNRLNSVVNRQVQEYLSAGNVHGIYTTLLANTEGILDKLIVIQAALDADTIPANADLWRLNQSYAETLLFGQYTAEVFYQIAGK